ncbi:MAG: peptidylprolyl isomerase [Gammaproteobacteria bacterium]|nr:peptidylprolyl isomerase [Gammaproteobacteria bacterium]
MIRRILLAVPALVLALAIQADEIDKVLVVVNDNVITESEFEQTLSRIKSDMRARGGDLPPEDQIRQRVLDRMILQEIQLQLADRAGIDVSQAELDGAMAEIASRNDLTPQQLRAAMEREGMDYDLLRDNIRSQMVTQRLAERQVARDVVVTDEEVDAFLSQPRSEVTGERTRYDISHILFPVSESDSEERVGEIRDQAVEVHRRIINGMDFEQAAMTYSQSDDAMDGGRVGWRAPSQLPDLFLDALNNTPKGGVTDVVRSPNGFHILKLNDAEGGGPEEVTQYKVRHILLRTDEFTSVQEAAQRLGQIRNRIINGEDFGELALAHSDDTVSSVQGGELDWMSPGDVVRPFEQAVETLEVGEVSEPVRTPYGVHIIELMDTRTATPSDMDRSIARRQLRAIKTEEKLQEWRDRLRDQAYVKIVNPV